MLKKTLFAMAAVAAVSGGAVALQATPAQAAAAAPAIAAAQAVEGSVIEVGHRRGRSWRHRHHRRCYFVRKKVRGYYGWYWKRVRVCPPRWHRKHHRRHYRRYY